MSLFKLDIIFLLLLSSPIYYNVVVEGIRMNNEESKETVVTNDYTVTKWALLVAGSNGYDNYRHQADVCHAYQMLRSKGLKDENIIVFMYDDIAYHPRNPTPGVIINKIGGDNVYDNVPKDYTGEDVTASNFYAVLSGNKKATSGGSGKVLNNGPDDSIFIYFSGHGNFGFLPMPSGGPIMKQEFNDALLRKEASKTGFDAMLIYIEACFAGSMFADLPTNLSIYATTASHPRENSFGTYCYKDSDSRTACLGDEFSVAWIEDSEQSNVEQETLYQQYSKVRQRTILSHVTFYGNPEMNREVLALFFIPEYFLNGPKEEQNLNFTLADDNSTFTNGYSQQDASTLYFFEAVLLAPEGSPERAEAQKTLDIEMAHRTHVDCVMDEIGSVMYNNIEDYYTKMMEIPSVVNDWNCYSEMISTYITSCGSSMYAMSLMHAFANMCNAGYPPPRLAEVISQVCDEVGKIVPSCKGR